MKQVIQKFRIFKFAEIKKLLLILTVFVSIHHTDLVAKQDSYENSSLTSTTTVVVEQKLKVGFDIDDTLLFSTPNFDNALNSSVEPYSEKFWFMVNKNDKKYSKIKQKVKQILDQHLKNGDEVYIITSRKPYGGEYLKRYLSKTFKIPKENIFFEPEGKTERIRSLGIKIYYGDSDSDIKNALEAGAKPVRVLRAKESSYKKSYNVGNYNEEILPDSEW